ncbi:MAG: ATPase, T2SS/T4P/T4SS family, partial [Microthrixaceae bacterium]
MGLYNRPGEEQPAANETDPTAPADPAAQPPGTAAFAPAPDEVVVTEASASPDADAGPASGGADSFLGAPAAAPAPAQTPTHAPVQPATPVAGAGAASGFTQPQAQPQQPTQAAGAGTPAGGAGGGEQQLRKAASPRTDQSASRETANAELRHRIHEQLIEELGPILFDTRLSEEDLRRKVNDQLHAAIAAERAPLSAADKAKLIQDVSDDILGYGPIDRLLRDEAVTEIMVNGPDLTFVERNGKLTVDESIRFIDSDHVRRVIDKIVSAIGRRVDESTPMVDARLPDGSRVNAVISPLAIGGPFLTIRKFATDPLKIDDLIRFGSINAHAARFLQAC